MGVLVPSGQPTQLVGLPALSEHTYEVLGKSMKEIYSEYVRKVEDTSTSILPRLPQANRSK
ncbi:hypothetical protein QFZ30_003076 [Arthrobacter pascens]|nr:hypothetical protein [Arthrobacter pascens]